MRDAWRALAERALGLLLAEAADGFAAARHTMRFTPAEGFAVEGDEQTGDTFPRALIADALCDLRDLDPPAVEPLVQREAAHLLDLRDTTGARAWRYFPGLSELPPDADDLAQVMQVLLRAGRRAEVEHCCATPIELVLASGMQTWIVPAQAPDEDLARQRWWIAHAWGAGADPEVVANFLFALASFDAPRFAAGLDAGLRWLLAQQEAAGWWPASWYHGPFYGTWVAVRALEALAPGDAALGDAARFFIRMQRPSGGWGPAPEGDVLSTSLALLALAAVARARGELTIPRELLPGAHAFLAGREPAADPLVRMELGRPTGKPWAVLTYGSAPVTAAFAGKAAIAWAALG